MFLWRKKIIWLKKIFIEFECIFYSNIFFFNLSKNIPLYKRTFFRIKKTLLRSRKLFLLSHVKIVYFVSSAEKVYFNARASHDLLLR